MSAARRRSTWLVPLALGLLAVVVTAVVLATGGADDDPSGAGARRAADAATPGGPEPVAVASDAPTFGSIRDLVGAADVVVRGRVATIERGRWFGSGAADGTRIQSRLITVEIEEVLAGAAPGADAVLVEEEGWLDDGTPIVVDGAPPVAVGDDAIWFLVEGGDPELAAYVVINGQGRFVAGADDALTGATGDDPLVAEVEAIGLDAFADAIRRAR